MAVKILMIDDHPSQIEGYKVILEYNELGLEIDSTPCYTSESAYKLLTSPAHPEFDIVFLDRNMPPYPQGNITTGEDLVRVIKKHLPKSLLVVITSHAEAFLLYDIVKKFEPAGVLVKSDFRAEELLDAFGRIMDGEKYLSETVEKSIKELLSKESYLDSFNRQIITLLGQGVKTKSLPNYVNLSLSAVEKRKAQVKDYFCLEKGSDEDIVREAKRLGFI
ncbi:MAG TPA: response regulator [Flavobacterium sp.]|jgi:DNA-binding NarL/FixJ family response regulator